jgi:surface carbohydrate biosynthesis protein (TIGR04326 family)
MLLWAEDPDAAPEHGNVVFWQGTLRRARGRSLSEYVDLHAAEVRRRYLAWSWELGEITVSGRKLRERFKLADGTSFWWYALFVEQSAWKQHSLEALLKLLALELLLERERPETLDFVGADRNLHHTLRFVCRRRGIRYRWSRTKRRAARSWARFARALPRPVHALLGLAYFARVRLALGRATLPAGAGTGRRVLICGPFANHNAALGADRAFGSRFWGILPQTLAQDGYELTWLHYFHAHEQVPNARAARAILQQLNACSTPQARHVCVESYLRPTDFARILGRWLGIAAQSLITGHELRRRFFEDRCSSYWPLIRADWARAFRGFPAVQSLTYLACFDRALASLERQDEGLYLMENQGWERCLTRSWHRRGHGRLTGVAHSTVRFWDVRYHSDPRRYADAARDRLPVPDCVVVNGGAAREQYLASCTEREPVVSCEALRYLHLVAGRPRPLDELANGARLRLLVLGDYTSERTKVLLSVAERAQSQSSTPLEIWVKPHPGCPLDANGRAHPSMKIVSEPVATLVASAHVVLASNTTSAALEAYVSGGRVLVLDDGSGVNYSPLREVPGVTFVSDADDVRRAIETLDTNAPAEARRTDGFFNIDPELRAWRRYLSPSEEGRNR